MIAARLGSVMAISACAVYLALVTAQLDRPLMYDDANFALAARAVAETGLPYGNQGWMSERGDFSQREQWALWHPPLYVYAEGLLARIGGLAPPVLRLAGVLGGLTTAVLTWRLAAEVTAGPPALRRLAGGLAVAMVMLCPLIVQSTLVLDIDFAVLVPLSLLFLVLYLRLEATRTSWLWLTPLFALLLWAKMTNPLALVLVAVVWQMLRGKPPRAGLHLMGIGVAGVALFGLSWLLAATWLGFPLDMPFSVNLVEARDSSDVARRAYTSVGAFIEGVQPTVVWLGPGLAALGLVTAAMRGAQLVRCWQIRRADLLIGLATVFVFGYVNKEAGWFPKYQVVLVPLLACLAAPLLACAWRARPRLVATAGGSAVVVAAAITLGLVRDRWALERTWAIQPEAAAALLLVPLGATLAGLRPRLGPAAAIFALSGLAIGWSVGVDVIQAFAGYQTDYWYGTTGTVQAADWVEAHIRPGETYVAAKEVAIRTHADRYVDQDNIVYFQEIGRAFDGTWAGEPVRALVVWRREWYLNQLFERSARAADFEEAATFGDYVVYVPRR